MNPWKKGAALLLCLLLTACAPTAYEPYTLTPKAYLMGELGTELNRYAPDGTIAQRTVEEIQAANGGQAQMLFGNQGYLSFLNGRYYDGIVTDQEDAIESIQGMAQLLGLGAGSEFFCTYGQQDKNGYTYFTFQQRYGECTVQYATLRVVIDPSGLPCGLSCSFTPNLGILEQEEWITPEQAEQIALQAQGVQMQLYPEYTQKVSVTFNDIQINGYAVYTSNFIQDAVLAGMPYLETIISNQGVFVTARATSVPVFSERDERAYSYYEGKTPLTWTGDVVRFDQTRETITVPMAYSEAEGQYYLMDTGRKIAVADYGDFVHRGFTHFAVSPDGKQWDNNALLAYLAYIRTYDFYAQRGYYGPDGTGVPILILTNYVDADGTPVNNACNLGIVNGFACFAVSAVNCYSESLDTTGHEYSHGVTGYSMGGMRYLNETGAINEAFSDIFGNLVEISLGATWDTEQWLIGEMCGDIIRSMSHPNDYYQPESRSDPYFQPPIPEDKLHDAQYIQQNDRGGVHQNNSLLSQVAYKLHASGMTLDEQASLWLTCIELMTPLSGYQEVHAALLMSLDINGIDAGYKQVITDAFLAAELL